jgi:glycogen synthase
MRILYISTEYPPDTGFGGIATYTKAMAEIMAGRGHTVEVITRSKDLKTLTKTINNVVVHRIFAGTYGLPQGRWAYPLRYLSYKNIPHSLIYRAWAIEADKAYCQLTAGNGMFDIVEYPDCGGEGCFVSRHKNQTTVCRLHTPWTMVRRLDKISEPVADRFYCALLEKSALRNASAISAPSQAIAAAIKKMWNIKTDSVFPNPLLPREYPVHHGNGWVYTGRVEYRKGVHLLLKAYSRLCRQFDPPLLTLVGAPFGNLPDGQTYGDYITGMIADLDLSQRVKWIKGVAHDEIFGYLAASAVAIFPSLWENFPYSCLEARACGCTVVVPRCGGFPEIVTDHKDGMVFDTENMQDLSGKLALLLQDQALQARLGTQAAHTASTLCNAQAIGKRSEDFYESLLNGNKK